MGFRSFVRKANVFDKDNRKAFAEGTRDIFSGDVSRQELSNAVEGVQRDIIPGSGRHENFFVGQQRLALGVTGDRLPPTRSQPERQAPSIAEVVDNRADQVKDAAKKIPGALNTGLEGLTEALAEALAAAGEGTTRGLLKGAGPALLVAGAGVVGVVVLKEKVL